MKSLFDVTRFEVRDAIISTCGSLYRGCRGVVTRVQTSADGTEYDVTITTAACSVLPEMTHACLFRDSQMVHADADPGRQADRPCDNCLCTMKERTVAPA